TRGHGPLVLHIRARGHQYRWSLESRGRRADVGVCGRDRDLSWTADMKCQPGDGESATDRSAGMDYRFGVHHRMISVAGGAYLHRAATPTHRPVSFTESRVGNADFGRTATAPDCPSFIGPNDPPLKPPSGTARVARRLRHTVAVGQPRVATVGGKVLP